MLHLATAIVFLLGNLVLIGSAASGGSSFKSITDGISFKAYFRVQTFARDELIYEADIYESYSNVLETGLIRQTSISTNYEHTKGTTQSVNELNRALRFLYASQSKRLLELSCSKQEESSQQQQQQDADDFYLYENGNSNSYRAPSEKKTFEGRGDSTAHCPTGAPESIRLVPEGRNLDSQLLTGFSYDDQEGQDSPKKYPIPYLDLDQFMRDECLKYLRERLHYINGLTRLLHLIECRRGDLKLQRLAKASDGARPAATSGAQLTRGQTRLLYQAKKLDIVSTNTKVQPPALETLKQPLDLLVTVHSSTTNNSLLEEGAIPLSIVLELSDREPPFFVLVNLYQFESVAPDEHLSESASGASIYLMPLAHPSSALAEALTSSPPSGLGQAASSSGQSFSFSAKLMGSQLDEFYREPTELFVSYDAQLGLLYRSESSRPSGAWSRSIVRQLYDSQSGRKFHLVEPSSESAGAAAAAAYKSRGEQEDDDKSSKQSRARDGEWRTCASDKLTSAEMDALAVARDSSALLDLSRATLMGEALVRGIRCQVYERRLSNMIRLPTWLGFSERDYGHLSERLARGQVFLILYAYGDSRFARLDFKFVASDVANDEKKKKNQQLKSITLELSSFEWSAAPLMSRSDATLFLSDIGDENFLENFAQECLLAVPGARHLDMELWFGLAADAQVNGATNSAATKSMLRALADDREMRDESVRQLLASTEELGISLIQQVDLESEILLGDIEQSEHLSDSDSAFMYVKFSLYELLADSVKEGFIGYAKSLALEPGRLSAPIVGTRTPSFAECKWRAIHSLEPNRALSEYNRRDDDDEDATQDLRLFAYCPVQLLCLLGDSSWLPMRRQKPLKLGEPYLLEYPYQTPSRDQEDDDDPTKCVVSSVVIKQELFSAKTTQKNKDLSAGQNQLNWWLKKGSNSGLGRAGDSPVERKARELRGLELKVKVSPSASVDPATAYVSETAHANDGFSVLGVKINKLKLSNRIFVSQNSNSNESENSESTGGWNDVSRLVKPLVGIAYYLPPKKSAVDQDSSPAWHMISNEPLVAASLAECSRFCLALHDCHSFSACHNDDDSTARQASTKMSCVFSRLTWSSAHNFEQLVHITSTATVSVGSANPLSLELTDGLSPTKEKVQVQFRQSRLCSLQARAQLDLYRMVKSLLNYRPAPKYLMRANSLEHCARMCQERAQLMRELALVKSDEKSQGSSPEVDPAPSRQMLGLAYRSAACHEYSFSAENAYCQLLPLRNHWAILGAEHMLLHTSSEGRNFTGGITMNHDTTSAWQQPGAQPSWLQAAAPERLAQLQTLNKWLSWLSNGGAQHEKWLTQLSSAPLDNADHYELDFEQIFVAQRNRRLALKQLQQEKTASVVASKEDDAQRDERIAPQVRLIQFSLYACAKRCIQLKWCRSFDVELPRDVKKKTLYGSATAAAAAEDGGGQLRANLCLLNMISMADLAADPSAWPSFEIKQERERDNSTSEWWHYEPTDLALFMITDPDEVSTLPAPLKR